MHSMQYQVLSAANFGMECIVSCVCVLLSVIILIIYDEQISVIFSKCHFIGLILGLDDAVKEEMGFVQHVVLWVFL